MMLLELRPYCQKTAKQFIEIMLANPRQNCVGCGGGTNEDWAAYDPQLILEFNELGSAAAGTLREFSDISGETGFTVIVGRSVFIIERHGDTFTIV